MHKSISTSSLSSISTSNVSTPNKSTAERKEMLRKNYLARIKSEETSASILGRVEWLRSIRSGTFFTLRLETGIAEVWVPDFLPVELPKEGDVVEVSGYLVPEHGQLIFRVESIEI